MSWLSPASDEALPEPPRDPDPADQADRRDRGRRARLQRRLAPVHRAVERHETLLWWLHSFYALLFGILFMWLGSRHYMYLRLAVFHLAFIWITSLAAVPALERTRLPAAWRKRGRQLVNYFNRNFYQQLLFFLLPVYYASATPWAGNMVFVGLVAVSAVVSTLDVFYDRHLSVRRGLMGVFFAFNLFAGVYVMLPVVWSIGHLQALRLSGGLALLAFFSMAYRLGDLRRVGSWAMIGAATVVIVTFVELGRWYIPPAPLRLVSPAFGYGFDRDRLRLESPVGRLPAGFTAPLYALTPIYAPLGLEDHVAHRWFLGSRPLSAPEFVAIRGGRERGFRLWTRRFVKDAPAGATVRVDVVTQAGQLIGRATIPVASGAR